MTGFEAIESGIDRRVFGIVSVALMLLFLRWGLPLLFLASEVPRSLVLLLLRASQLSSPVQKRVMSDVRAAMGFAFSWSRCRASHSSRMLCLKAAKASVSGQSTIWFFLVRNLFQSWADSPDY